MCGIVGYVGYRKAVPVLIQGLEHLEYRGYDSAGIACLNHRGVSVVKEKGNLSHLKQLLNGAYIESHTGIGHTRWATHGEPSRANAHPHTDPSNRIALVHNGIIENYALLKQELQRKGFRFRSQTDTEVAVNLIASYYKKGNLVEAFRHALKRMHGFFAFVVISQDEPDQLLIFKRSNPLIIGLGKRENFIASDVPAILPYTHRVLYLEDEEYAVVTPKQVSVFSLAIGRAVRREPVTIRWDIAQARKGGYPHFMLKEIYEQPAVLEETASRLLNNRGQVFFETMNRKLEQRLKGVEKVFFVSCGTAYHAGLVGSYMVEELARVPAEAQFSSEFRYQNPIVTNKDMVVFITQSGETADTLAALREAKSKGAMTLAIVNVLGSTIAREAGAVIYTHAGPEIGVASTKAYTAQLATLAFFTLYYAELRNQTSAQKYKDYVQELQKLPGSCTKILKLAKAIARCAKKHYEKKNFLYLGRGYNFPTALEGALKLKEISYAHAHGYAAGEMKHGPIALVDRDQPVICITPQSSFTYEKMISNIEEIRARQGIVIAIGSDKDQNLKRLADDFFEIPSAPELLTPILAVVPLQIFAYHMAVFNGRNVDQPRNLAKSVTVE